MKLTISFIKETALIYSTRVFETHNGISIMFGDSEKFYSWFPGPGEIKLNVTVNEFTVNFTLDTISLQGVDFNSMIEFLRNVEEANRVWFEMNLQIEKASRE
jgi:hypothetical protein